MKQLRIFKLVWVTVFTFFISENITAQCIDTNQINTSINCPTFEEPVCGCDGITYSNHCVAENHFGITEWTYGACQAQNCASYFSYETAGENFIFFNESLGDFQYSEWDFGNGFSLPSVEAQVNYEFVEDGFFTVCLTISDDNNCSSIYCEEVFAGNWEEVCNYTDCVYPGDADGGGTANIYDVLNIGIGYGESGIPRETADLAWNGQYGADWNQQTINGIDYKHIDCDGNGIIDAFDLTAIDLNYTPANTIIEITEPNAPKFWLEMSVDSIFIDEDSPMFLSFSFDLMAGTANNPIEDLKGFALTINYPEDIIQDGSVEVDYYDNSFLGISNEILWLPKDRPEVGKLDLAFVQKGGAKSGFGKIATVNYIIIVDVINRNETHMTLDIPIDGEVAIGPMGILKAIGETDDEADFTFVITNPTAAKEKIISDKISVYPNPVDDILNIDLNGLKGEKVELFNTLGQQILSQNIEFKNQVSLNVENLNTGVYILKVDTEEGIATKRILIE